MGIAGMVRPPLDVLSPLVGLIYLSLGSENNPTDLLLCIMYCFFSLATSLVNSFSQHGAIYYLICFTLCTQHSYMYYPLNQILGSVP